MRSISRRCYASPAMMASAGLEFGITFVGADPCAGILVGDCGAWFVADPAGRQYAEAWTSLLDGLLRGVG